MVADAHSCLFAPLSTTRTLQHATHAGCQDEMISHSLEWPGGISVALISQSTDGLGGLSGLGGNDWVAMIAWHKAYFPYPPLP